MGSEKERAEEVAEKKKFGLFFGEKRFLLLSPLLARKRSS